uniref:Putative signal transduction protein (SH3 domain) n=1 Tax=Magnetococcus massalia (strain MO-1) TaxID=451514 RepID=A0A1S7LP32_MAGMO|nr:putative signal transduction protein (SH3 domain) [Candidatus Magnetococcus massalia]
MGSLQQRAPLLFALMLLLPVLPAQQADAATRYVTDEFRIMMRGGPKNSFRIKQVLKSGAPVEVLERGDSGWDRVRTTSGRTGWVLTRYLSDQPAARTLVDQAVTERAQALKDRDRLKEQVLELKGQIRDQRRLESELAHIKRVSQDALTLEQENHELRQQMEVLQNKLQEVSDENRLLERQSDTQFFLAGAGVLILGILGGSMLSRRRKRPYDGLV